jgi:hypothetical protein
LAYGLRCRLSSSANANGTDEVMDNPLDLKHRQVTFEVCRVHLPAPSELLMQLHGSDVLQGEVLDVTADRSVQTWYAVVHVEGVNDLVIVPVEQILGVVRDGSQA